MVTVYCKATCKRKQHFWSTTPNIVGCYVLRPFPQPVACCGVLLGVSAPSLKLVNFLSQQLPILLLRDRRSVAQQDQSTMLDPFVQRSQHCWGHAQVLHMVSNSIMGFSKIH